MIKIDFNPPDVWYDFYARLLPGLAAVAYLAVALGVELAKIGGAAVVLFTALGFLFALMTESVSTHVVDAIQCLALTIYTRINSSSLLCPSEHSSDLRAIYRTRPVGLCDSRHFYAKVEALAGKSRSKTGYTTHSKMHAECVAMVQIVILGLASGCIVNLSGNVAGWPWLALILILALLNALSFAYRRARRMLTRMEGIAFDWEDHNSPQQSVAEQQSSV